MNKNTILIADDDLGLAEVLAKRCEAIGLNTIVVDNAQCAQFAMVTEQPSLAILDLNMPGADAGNILDVLAADRDLADVPVVLLTGEKDSAVACKCESLQVQYMTKQRNVWARLKEIILELMGDRREPFPHPSARGTGLWNSAQAIA